MENLENQLPAQEATANATNQQHRNKKQGKGSKQRNLAKFRDRKNAQSESNRLASLAKSLKLFDTDDTQELQKVAETVQLTAQQRAVPLSVTTRSIGFSTAIFYDRAATTWNLAAVAEIATIHQCYRVHLWLAHYKVFKAQQLQVETVTNHALRRVFISDEIREMLDTIGEVPSIVTLVLDSIGKIESGSRIYHMGYSIEPGQTEQLEYSTVCVNPDNIRNILLSLSNPVTPEQERIEYEAYNSIPGAHFQDHLLLNPNEIYPAEYSIDELSVDVHAFKNLLTRVQPRLPKHAILRYNCIGKAVLSGLWSGPRTRTRIVADFKPGRPIAVPRHSQRSRNARGEPCEVVRPPAPSAEYAGSTMVGERVNYWSPEETPNPMAVVGIASLVGEECFIHSRYELSCPVAVTGTASTFLHAFSDAPR